MNPRLKQLAQNSGFNIVTDSEGDHVINITDDAAQNLEKFGRAVLQDCVSIVALIGISNFENDDISWTVELAIKQMRERFGEFDGNTVK